MSNPPISLDYILAQLKHAQSKMLIQDFELHRKPCGKGWLVVYLHIELNQVRYPQQAIKLAQYFTKHGHTVTLKSKHKHVIVIALHPDSYKDNSGNLHSNP